MSAWRESGETADVFAGRRGWSPRTLTWWASQLRRAGKAATASMPGGFVRLVPSDADVAASGRPATTKHSERGAIDVVLGRDLAIRVAPGADLSLLRAVIDALGAR